MMTDAMEQGTQAWREARASGIGGSEISALFYLPDGRRAHPWLSEMGLWLAKTGRVESVEATIHETPHLYWGTALEPVVRQGYQDLTGRKVIDGHTMLRHPECSILVANTDGTQVDVDDMPGPGIYEGKASSAFRRDEWVEDIDGETLPTIPLHYQVQGQHYCACTGFEWGTVAVFLGGARQPLIYRDFERHEGIISEMIERAARWWRDHVEADVPPRVDSSKETEVAMREAWSDGGDFVALPSGFDAIINAMTVSKRQLDAVEATRQTMRNWVISTMRGAAYAETPSGRGFAFSEAKDGSRRLRILSHAAIDRAKSKAGVERPRATYVAPDVAEAVTNIERMAWSMEYGKAPTVNQPDEDQ